MKYRMAYFSKLDKKLKIKLKRRFVKKHSLIRGYMFNQLCGTRNLSGAVVAFSKSGYIIGWSSIDIWGKSCFINTYISKRYRGKGIATALIKQCTMKHPNTNYMVADIDNLWVSFDTTKINRLELRNICGGSADISL